MGVVCKLCGKVFFKQSNLNRHVREVHNLNTTAISYDKNVWNYKCLELNCNSSYQQNKSLVNHLQKAHGKTFDIEEMQLSSKNEFESWKSAIELKYKCRYVVSSRCSSTTGEITYYNCSRSKTGKTACKERQRQLKSQGSSKLNFCCTSQIELINEGQAGSNEITVHWNKTHYGHSLELQHLRLQKCDRENVALQLISGVTAKKIVDQTRDKIGEQLKRIDLLTAKDVDNIKRSFKIETREGKRHENDAISIDLWVQECNSKPFEENPVLLYKQQGIISNILEEKDFCLIIMNRFQEVMLKKFGNNVLAIDGTHGLNNYDFELTTLMVIDEFGEGFPVTFMFSNRKDTHIYKVLFQTLKEKVGTVCAKTFMSDMAETFYNAWSSCMGPVTYHLYCSWHVDRAWQSNLTKIKNKDKRTEVYKYLKVLQEELNELQFEKKKVEVLNSMLNDKDTEVFGQYFQANYMMNCRQWAYCFRKDAGINTNMRLESMHKTIKYFYLDHKKIKRLDKGLHAILKFLKDKSVDRILKLVKGENTAYNRDSFKRHRLATSSEFNIDVQNENSWDIIHKSEKYHVIRLSQFSCCNLTCSICKICFHMYSCNDCYDFIRHSKICKHIHYIHLLNDEAKVDISEKPLENQNNMNNFLPALTDQTKSKDLTESIEHKIKNTLQTLQNADLKSLDDTVILQIHTHLNVLSNLLSLPTTEDKEEFQNIENNFPANKNINPQLRLYSTQKKRKASTNICKKPSEQETADINDMLNNKPVLYISKCAENDHTYL